MKRLCYSSKDCGFVWKNWIPKVVTDFGPSVTQKKKYVTDKVRINNQEVTTGSSRTALYTMPDGIDTGVRYAALYEQKGLDPTEIEANKQLLANAKESVEEMISSEVQKELETVTASQSDSNANEG